MLNEVFFNTFIGILLTIGVFSFIVFIHEFGHFIAAKLFGVKVEEFGMGLPPRVFEMYEDNSGTVYSLNLLPIGGFVSLKGEKYDELTVFEKDSLAGANIFKQMIIVLAGVTMNFLLACVIFTIIFTIGVQPLYVDSKFQIDTDTKLILTVKQAIDKKILNVSGLRLTPIKGSIAEKDGLKPADILVAINGKKVTEPEEMINAVKYGQAPLVFTIFRDKNQEMNININPVDGKIGSYVDYNYVDKNKDFIYKYPFNEAIKIGFEEGINQTRYMLAGLKMVAKKIITPKTNTERKEAISTIGGPISLGTLFIDMVNFKAQAMIFVIVAALLSLNLAIFNLLPLPALDGGRFFIMLVNSIVILFFGKKAIDERVETIIHVVGFVLLIGLSILVAYLDIFKLFTK